MIGMENNGVDLISKLPDALLLHIFSFLDEMAVFQSSILSRRWRYLWTLVPFPTHTKKMKSSFMELREYHREFKLRHEEVARKDVSDLSIFIAKSIRTYFFWCLLLLAMLEFKNFAVFNIFCTLSYMRLIYSGWCWRHSSLCDEEARLRRIEELDSRLMSDMNTVFTTIPMMEPLFPENFQPRYTKSSKVYGLFGMLAFMIVSCSLTVLKWKFDFSHATEGLRLT